MIFFSLLLIVSHKNITILLNFGQAFTNFIYTQKLDAFRTGHVHKKECDKGLRTYMAYLLLTRPWVYH